MPEIFTLTMGTYASGTPYTHEYHRSNRKVKGNKKPINPGNHTTHGKLVKTITNRTLCDTLGLSQHLFKDIKEILSQYMFRNNTEGINIRARTVHAKSIRSECKDFAASCVGGSLGKTSGQRDFAYKGFDESGEATEYNFPM